MGACMKKLLTFSLCLLFGFTALGLTACGKSTARSRYDIHAEYLQDEGILTCEMTADIVNTTDTALETLPFQLYPNAYREGAIYPPVSELFAPSAYYDGSSYGGIEILSVEGGSYTVGGEDENILYISLEEPLYPDETVTLTFSFEVTLAHIDHRLGIGERAINLANFYPVLCAYQDGGFVECVYSYSGDPFVSECADYTVSLTLPEGYEAVGARFAEGAEQKRGTHVWELHAENVRDVAFVLGEGFKSMEREQDGVLVTYAYLEDANPELTLSVACESLGYFSKLFGEYEYPTYTVVQTDFPYGGMEYPALCMVSSLLREEEIPAVVAHETAHQWWYSMVGSDQYTEAWQDEGLAEFSAALFLEEHPQYGGSYREAVAAAESSYRAFFSVYSQVKGSADTRMSRPLTEYAGEYEYRNVSYDKGLILFDRLMDVAGEKRVLRALEMYKENYSGKIASAADFIACFGKAGAHAEELILSFTEGRCVI